MSHYDAIIIGGGPAGVSAALYLARANAKTLIIENGPNALAKAHKIDNYYAASKSGVELYADGLAQAKALGVTIITDELINAEFIGGYSVKLKGSEETYTAPVLVLATGTKKASLNLPGLAKLEGKGVSYCAVCDGFFFRKKKVAVIGHGAFALNEAQHLAHLAESVTVLTNGEDASLLMETGLAHDTRKLQAVQGVDKVESVLFEDGASLAVDGIFLALGTADSTDLARRLGAQLNGRFIQIDAQGQTNMPGLFAAGDCTGGLFQVAKAVYQGAEAGLAASKYLREQAKR